MKNEYHGIELLELLDKGPCLMSSSEKEWLYDMGLLRRDINGNSVLSEAGKAVMRMTAVAVVAALRTLMRVRDCEIALPAVSLDIRMDLKAAGWTKMDRNGNTVVTKRGFNAIRGMGKR